MVRCPEDYKLWCETMFSLFGTKWSKIHVGPMWSVALVAQGEATPQSNRKTVEVYQLLSCEILILALPNYIIIGSS